MKKSDRPTVEEMQRKVVAHADRLARDIDYALRGSVNAPVVAASVAAVLLVATKRAVSALDVSLQGLHQRAKENGHELDGDAAKWNSFASSLCYGMTHKLDDELLHHLYICSGAPETAGRMIFSRGVMDSLRRMGWVSNDEPSVSVPDVLPGVTGVRDDG